MGVVCLPPVVDKIGCNDGPGGGLSQEAGHGHNWRIGSSGTFVAPASKAGVCSAAMA